MEIIEWFRQQSLAKRWQLALVGVLAVGVLGYSLSSSQVESAENPVGLFEPLQFENTISVHVVGEVAKPGIYDLPSDSRVFDAIFAAGGFSDKADQASINLARTLSDGEQIIKSIFGSIGQEIFACKFRAPGCCIMLRQQFT